MNMDQITPEMIAAAAAEQQSDLAAFLSGLLQMLGTTREVAAARVTGLAGNDLLSHLLVAARELRAAARACAELDAEAADAEPDEETDTDA